MSVMESFVPQEDLLAEVSESQEAATTLELATSPVISSDFEDAENEEIRKICGEENSEVADLAVVDPAQPIISLT